MRGAHIKDLRPPGVSSRLLRDSVMPSSCPAVHRLNRPCAAALTRGKLQIWLAKNDNHVGDRFKIDFDYYNTKEKNILTVIIDPSILLIPVEAI